MWPLLSAKSTVSGSCTAAGATSQGLSKVTAPATYSALHSGNATTIHTSQILDFEFLKECHMSDGGEVGVSACHTCAEPGPAATAVSQQGHHAVPHSNYLSHLLGDRLSFFSDLVPTLKRSCALPAVGAGSCTPTMAIPAALRRRLAALLMLALVTSCDARRTLSRREWQQPYPICPRLARVDPIIEPLPGRASGREI